MDHLPRPHAPQSHESKKSWVKSVCGFLISARELVTSPHSSHPVDPLKSSAQASGMDLSNDLDGVLDRKFEHLERRQPNVLVQK